MNIGLISLLFIWLVVLVALTIVTLITMMMPKVFKLRDNVERSEERLVKRTIIAGPLADSKSVVAYRMSAFGGGLSFVTAILVPLTTALDYFVLGMGLTALTAGLYLFFGVAMPKYQYKYWSQHESADFTLLAPDKFSKLIRMRVVRTVLLIIIFLMPTIFSEQFLEILNELIPKIMGY